MRVRTNMRYRGPMESMKDESMRRQMEANILKLKERFASISEASTDYRERIHEGYEESVLDGPIPARMDHMQRDIELIERGVKHV